MKGYVNPKERYNASVVALLLETSVALLVLVFLVPSQTC